MNLDLLTYRIAFASIRSMGYDLARKILEVVPSEQAFFEMTEAQLKQLIGRNNRILDNSYRNECIEKAKREHDFVVDKGIQISYFSDADYPARLAQASDAPILLYSIGSCDMNATRLVSIVGTRRMTEYGRHFCEKLVADLAQMLPGTVIVSGLAYGADICAHRAALKHGLPTIGVQARGLNKIYPANHRNDAARIVHQGGRIVSDYTSQDEIHKGNFVARNRIIAAMSDCTVVIESADKGGALITANIAASYNRDVFAFPGRINDEYSKGCNRLIMNNQAGLITSATDLLHAMGWESADKQPESRELELFPQLNKEESAIVELLRQKGEAHVNLLTECLDMPVYKVMTMLVEMECRGLVMTMPGCRYRLAIS